MSNASDSAYRAGYEVVMRSRGTKGRQYDDFIAEYLPPDPSNDIIKHFMLAYNRHAFDLRNPDWREDYLVFLIQNNWKDDVWWLSDNDPDWDFRRAEHNLSTQYGEMMGWT